jgi:transposase
MEQHSELFVGLDVSKLKISVAVAEAGRQGEVRFLGDIEARPTTVAAMIKKLERSGAELHFCYEAGPTGYELFRQITASGHACDVIAPSLTPRRPGDRVKTNRRDALSLARSHRSGDLTSVWVPDRGHEAVRDLLRARETAVEASRTARNQLQSFLMRHGRIFPGKKMWGPSHTRWLCRQAFEHAAHHAVLEEYRRTIAEAQIRVDRLTQLVADAAAHWSLAPVVSAYQAMRGVSLVGAATFVAEIGDVRRFDSPRQLMAFLGLVPSESSTGERVQRGGITKAGNTRARRVLVEGAWTYRFPARLSESLNDRQAGLPQVVRDIAWKAQVRLCRRYQRLLARGKLKTVATTAIAREMAAFLWAIGHEVPPVKAA